MSRKPVVLAVSQIQEVAKAAVATALAERTVALTEREARETSGGEFLTPGTKLDPFIAGGLMVPDPIIFE